MIRVKVSSNGLGKDFSIGQFSKSKNNQIDNVKFFFNPGDYKEYDFWFVLDDLGEKYERNLVRRGGLFFFTSEQIWDDSYYLKNRNALSFIDNFDKVFSSYVMLRKPYNYELPFLPWMINQNHGSYDPKHFRDINYFQTLDKIPKSKFMSVFCSNKEISPWQSVRLKFVSELKEALGSRLDWFGNGVSPLVEKWDGIAPYKYHIVLENRISNNLITEKLYDSYLGLSLPLYAGAPNVGNFFPEKSFITLDIKNKNESVNLIYSLYESEVYETRIQDLILARNLVLNKYNLWCRLSSIALKYYNSLGSSQEFSLKKIKTGYFF